VPAGLARRGIRIRELPVDQGPGIVLLLDAAFGHMIEVVSGFGKLRVTAELSTPQRRGG
jgi:RNA 3'-terminal phosphate cyclase (ATP)